MSTRPEECGYCNTDHPSSRPCPTERKPRKKARTREERDWLLTAGQARTSVEDAAHLVVGLVNIHGLDKLNDALEKIGAGSRVKDAKEYFDDPGGAVCPRCNERSLDPNHAANCPAGGDDEEAEDESAAPAAPPAPVVAKRPRSLYHDSIIKYTKCATDLAPMLEEIMRTGNGGVLDGLYPEEFRREAKKALAAWKIMPADLQQSIREDAKRWEV